MILILCSSEGKNLELSQQLLQLGEAEQIQLQMVRLVGLDLPLYSSQAEAKGIPQKAIELTQQMNEATGFVFVAPEYNGSLPPVLNNALAWVSRSGNENWRSAFQKKFAALATHSGGGGEKVLQAMRTQLEHLGCNVLARQLLTHYQKPLNPESGTAVLQELKGLCS